MNHMYRVQVLQRKSAVKLCYSLHCIISRWRCGCGARQFFCFYLNKMLVVVSAVVLVVYNVMCTVYNIHYCRVSGWTIEADDRTLQVTCDGWEQPNPNTCTPLHCTCVHNHVAMTSYSQKVTPHPSLIHYKYDTM